MQFDFDRHLKYRNHQFNGQDFVFVEGIDGQAVALNPDKGYSTLILKNVSLDGTKDFSIQCWIKTISNKPMVFLSQKSFRNKGITTQKNAGWVLYHSEGTFGWSIGSGMRRINYERDNGERMPVNDGDWHQMTITYSKVASEFRLYYDGHNKAIYKVNFDFENSESLVIGSLENSFDYETQYFPEIESGKEQLQTFVDAFNDLGLAPLKDEEFIDLIVNPDVLFDKKYAEQVGSGTVSKDELPRALDIRKGLLENPYNVYQNRALTNLKPVSKIYALQAGKVVINKSAGLHFTQNEKLYPADFAMDKLSIWEKTLSEKEVLDSYTRVRKANPFKLVKNLKQITVGVWNIWHGGIHWSLEEDGWDSRLRIVEILKEKNVDVVLMQETYSSGDFIAAELGYYYATTSDLDYCFQGSNISVISRYPIKEVRVSREAEFNNVAVKLAISKTQEIWAISNWYGMAKFPSVFDFHRSRFEHADKIPVLFGGDFNAVPHTDGGDSPASKKMLESGFTDAFRNSYPDVENYPGFTHRNDKRIDQLYFKGRGLKNTLTEVISSWPTGFPSDHYLIVSKFKLNP
jgi:exonuclease III